MDSLDFLHMPSEFIYRTIHNAVLRANQEDTTIFIKNSQEFCELCESAGTWKHMAAWITYTLALEHLNIKSSNLMKISEKSWSHESGEDNSNKQTISNQNYDSIPAVDFYDSSHKLNVDIMTNVSNVFEKLMEMVLFHAHNISCPNENESIITNSPIDTAASLFEKLSLQSQLSPSIEVLQLMPTGILICGSCGSGKSSFLKLLMRKTIPTIKCIELSTTTLIQKEVGMSERCLQEIVVNAKKIAKELNTNNSASRNTVVMLVIDDLDRFFPVDMSRCPSVSRRLLDVFLAETESLEGSGVVLVATSQSARHIHPALLRHGRFEELLFLDGSEKSF